MVVSNQAVFNKSDSLVSGALAVMGSPAVAVDITEAVTGAVVVTVTVSVVASVTVKGALSPLSALSVRSAVPVTTSAPSAPAEVVDSAVGSAAKVGTAVAVAGGGVGVDSPALPHPANKSTIRLTTSP
jgi:hypothetical protein